MALIQCKGCGHSISDRAKECPKCHWRRDEDGRADVPLPPQLPKDNNPNRYNKTLLSIVFIFFFIIGLGGCFVYYHHKSSAIEKELVNDTIRNETAASDQKEKLMRDSIALVERVRSIAKEQDSFTAPDLALLELHGHVESVKYSRPETMMVYVINGNKFQFNWNGAIIGKTRAHSSEYNNISYTPDGKVKKVSQSQGFHVVDIDFLYNGDGNLKQVNYHEDSHGYETFITYSFEIKGKDEHGNWTSRRVTESKKELDGYTQENPKPKYSKNTYTETRKISYYDYRSDDPEVKAKLNKTSKSEDLSKNENTIVGKRFSGYGNSGGLGCEMEIEFKSNGKCTYSTNWYCSYSSTVTEEGRYKISGQKVTFIGKEGSLTFNLSKEGKTLSFNNSVPNTGTMGNDFMTLNLRN